jgi:acyl-CoA thioesterase FadM
MAFTYPQRVRFQHCDPAGIVFFPRYFEMVNATVEEWFATRLDLPFSEMHGPTHGGVPTATIRADFTAPSRLGEMLDWTLVPRRLGPGPRAAAIHVDPDQRLGNLHARLAGAARAQAQLAARPAQAQRHERPVEHLAEPRRGGEVGADGRGRHAAAQQQQQQQCQDALSAAKRSTVDSPGARFVIIISSIFAA